MPLYKGIPLDGGLNSPTGTGSQNIVLALKGIIDYLIDCTVPGRLVDATAGLSVDWGIRHLYNAAAALTVDYQTANLYTSSDGTLSLNWDARQFSAADGSISADFQNRLLKNGGSLPTVDYASGFLYDPATGTISIDWVQCHATDPSNALSIDWQGRALFDIDGTTEQLRWGLGLFMPTLPTADPGSTGQLWNNLGVLNISP